ncbi:uncharacterized protein LOC100181622 [Ciona intestinalis]
MVSVLQQYCCVLMVALVAASSTNKIDKLVEKTLLRSKRMVTSECPSRMYQWPDILPALCCPCSKCPEDHLYTGHYNYADECWGEDEEYSCNSDYEECLGLLKAWEIFWTTTTSTATIPPSTTPKNITAVAITPTTTTTTTTTTTEASTLLQVPTTKEGNNLALYAIVGILSLLCILASLWLLRRKYKNKYQDLKKYLRTVCAGNKPGSQSEIDSSHTPLRKPDLDRQDTVEEVQESYSCPAVKLLESPPDGKRHIVDSKRTVFPVQATPYVSEGYYITVKSLLA